MITVSLIFLYLVIDFFQISQERAEEIKSKVLTSVSKWEIVATKVGLSRGELQTMKSTMRCCREYLKLYMGVAYFKKRCTLLQTSFIPSKIGADISSGKPCGSVETSFSITESILLVTSSIMAIMSASGK